MQPSIQAGATLLMLASSTAFPQLTATEPVRISGSVLDLCGSPVPQALVTVNLLRSDATVVTTATDQDGEFVTPTVPPQVYLVQIKAEGAEVLSKTVDASNGSVDIPVIVDIVGRVNCPSASPLIRIKKSPTPSTLSPEPPSVADVLQNIKATYTNLKQYSLAATITDEHLDIRGKKTVGITEIVVAVQKPGKFRWEARGSGAATYTGMYAGDQIIVSDGQTVSWYESKPKLYSRRPFNSSERLTPMGSVSAYIDNLEARWFGGYTTFAAFAGGAKLLRDETVSANGSTVDCYVVQITTPLSTVFTWWVDKERYLVLREVFEGPPVKRTTISSVANVNEPIGDTLFVFNPPPGARQSIP